MITLIQTSHHVIDLSRMVFMNLHDDYGVTLHFDDGRELKLTAAEAGQLGDAITTLSIKRQLVVERQTTKPAAMLQ